MANTSDKHMTPTRFLDITSDRISSIPDEILHHILSLMTAREAVQTCVLSTRWRDVWMSLRRIEVEASFRLDEECFSSPYVNCNIISALSNVTKLKLFFGLDNETVSKVLRRDLWRCQAFNYLKTLSVSGWCIDVDLRALVYFLRRSPALEKLTLCLSQVGTSDRLQRRDNMASKETNTSFNCEHLKKVKIRCPQGDKRVGNILNVILASASLPEIVINPYERWDPLE